jgi:hypothetical protein
MRSVTTMLNSSVGERVYLFTVISEGRVLIDLCST